MTLAKTIFVALAMLFACSGAFAIPNLNTESGYILVPDASVVPLHGIDISGSYVATEGSNQLSALALSPILCHGRGPNFRGIYGFTPNAEIGFGWLNVEKAIGHSSATTLAGKYQFIDDQKSSTTVSFGANVRNWITSADVPLPSGGTLKLDIPIVGTGFLVVDKGWSPSNTSGTKLTTTLGLMVDHYGHSRQKPVPFAPSPPVPININTGLVSDHTFFVPFLGVKAECRSGWSLLADFKMKERHNGFEYQGTTWSAAIRKAVTSRLTGTTGITTFNLPYTNPKPGWFVDLAYKLK